MGKGHYSGGGSLIGFGRVLRSRGRKGGLGDTSADAQRERERVRQAKAAQASNIQIKKNQKLARKLGKEWSEAKGKAHYNRLVNATRVKSSSLAAALAALFPIEDKKDDK